MRRRTLPWASVAALASAGLAADAADAAFCRKKSGALFVRTACWKKEVAVDLQARVTGTCAPARSSRRSAPTALSRVSRRPTRRPACRPASRARAPPGRRCRRSARTARRPVRRRASSWGQIRDTGTIRSASPNVSGATRLSAGKYCISFSNAPASPDQIESAVASLAGNPTSGIAFVRVQSGQDNFVCDGLRDRGHGRERHLRRRALLVRRAVARWASLRATRTVPPRARRRTSGRGGPSR
jgi:hypothetical protein